MIHQLKCEPEFFQAILDGEKTFEARLNDRDFRKGDYLALNELGSMYPSSDGTVAYSGRALLVFVKQVVEDPRFCKEGFVIMSIEHCAVRTFSDWVAATLAREPDVRPLLCESRIIGAGPAKVGVDPGG